MNTIVLFAGAVLTMLMVAYPPYYFAYWVMAEGQVVWVSKGSSISYAPIWQPPTSKRVLDAFSDEYVWRIDTFRLILQLGAVAVVSLLGAWAKGGRGSQELPVTNLPSTSRDPKVEPRYGFPEHLQRGETATVSDQ